MVVGCGLWISAVILPEPPRSQPGSSGSLWAAVEPPRPLLADSSRALSCLQGRPPFLCQAGLIYQSTHQDLPQKCVWDFLGAQRGVGGFLGF